MIKIALGFIIGISTTAIADTMIAPNYQMNVEAIVLAGESPSNHAKAIKTDENGYVICSTEQPR